MANKKKSSGGGFSIIWLVIVLVAVSEFVASAGKNGDMVAMIVIIAVIIGSIAIITAVEKAKKNGKSSAEAFSPEIKRSSAFTERVKSSFTESKIEHSHDRLSTSGKKYETPQEHWKSQLDGFVAAGLIDKKEYTALWNKYKDRL